METLMSQSRFKPVRLLRSCLFSFWLDLQFITCLLVVCLLLLLLLFACCLFVCLLLLFVVCLDCKGQNPPPVPEGAECVICFNAPKVASLALSRSLSFFSLFICVLLCFLSSFFSFLCLPLALFQLNFFFLPLLLECAVLPVRAQLCLSFLRAKDQSCTAARVSRVPLGHS